MLILKIKRSVGSLFRTPCRWFAKNRCGVKLSIVFFVYFFLLIGIFKVFLQQKSSFVLDVFVSRLPRYLSIKIRTKKCPSEKKKKKKSGPKKKKKKKKKKKS